MMIFMIVFPAAFFLLVLWMPETVGACTSFAVYSKEVYYAMNFDFLNIPMKFVLSVNGDIKTVHLAFERCLGDMRFFVNTAAMNNKGLFAACQELHPENENPPPKTEANQFTFELYEAVAHCRSVDEIVQIAAKRPIIDMAGITLHNLFADKTGRAVVTEAGESAASIVEMDGRYLVMTNFSNQTIVGKHYLEADGKGADRYQICHNYLRQHIDEFSIDHGFELLSMACNQDLQYPTSCSMVFDPQQNEIYIVLHKEFSKRWKLSIESQTIEGWKGFQHPVRIPIPPGPEGLPADDLIQQEASQDDRGIMP